VEEQSLNKWLNVEEITRITRRWWWVVVLSLFVFVAAALTVTAAQTPIYEAAVEIIVRGSSSSGIPTAADLSSGARLTSTLERLVTTRTNFETIRSQLGLDPRAPLVISVASNGSIITISAQSASPARAADVANAAAEVFIEDFLSRQFLQLAQYAAQARSLGVESDAAFSGAQASVLSTLDIIETASAPSAPVRPSKLLSLTAGVVASLALSFAIIFALETIKQRIPDAAKLSTLTKWALLGSVPIVPSSKNAKTSELILSPVDGAPEFDSFDRSFAFITSNLGFAAIGTGGVRVLVISCLQLGACVCARWPGCDSR
jgi:capsular polysaccharide biosynthesis protein